MTPKLVRTACICAVLGGTTARASTDVFLDEDTYETVDVAPLRVDRLFVDEAGVAWALAGLQPALITADGLSADTGLALSEPIEEGVALPNGAYVFVTIGFRVLYVPPGQSTPIVIDPDLPEGLDGVPAPFTASVDAEGTAWVLTDKGPWRLDEDDRRLKPFVPFTSDGTPSLHWSTPSYGVAVEGDRYWFGLGEQGGVVVTDRRGEVLWRLDPPEATDGPQMTVTNFAFRAEDAFLFTARGLFRTRLGSDAAELVLLEARGGSSVPASPFFYDTATIDDWVLAAANPGGLLRIRPETGEAVQIDERPYYRVVATRAGALAARRDALVRVVSQTVRAQPLVTGRQVRHAARTSDEAYVLVTGEGIEMLAEGETQVIYPAGATTSDGGHRVQFFTTLTPLGDGRYLVGSDAGLCAFTLTGGDLTCHPAPPWGLQTTVRSARVISGDTWVSTTAGLFVMQGVADFAPLAEVPGFEGQNVLGVAAVGPDRVVVAAATGSYLLEPTDASPASWKVPTLLSKNPPTIVTGADDDSVLMGTLFGGLVVYDPLNASTRTLVSSADLPSSYVTSLMQADGATYVGTTNGLVRINEAGRVDERWGAEVLPSLEVTSIVPPGPDGRVAVATAGGMVALPRAPSMVPEAFLRTVRLGDEDLGTYPRTPEGVRMRAGSGPLSLTFGGVGGSALKDVTYRLGAEASREPLPPDGAVLLSALASARYDVHLEARDPDGRWTPVMDTFPIEVTPRWHERPVTYAAGTGLAGLAMVGAAGAVQRRRRLEREVAIRAKSVQEAHHRIKNSLQVVSSVLAMQGHRDPTLAGALQHVQERIEGVARVHDRLAREDGTHVPIAELIGALTDAAGALHGMPDLVAFERTADPAAPPEDALTIGMIYNELLTNALRHGDVDQDRPVHVELGPDELTLTNATLGEKRSPPGLGTHVVDALARQAGIGLHRTRKDDRYAVRIDLGRTTP